MKNKLPEAESIITYVFAVGIPVAIFIIELIQPGSVWGIRLGIILVVAGIIYGIKSLLFQIKYNRLRSKFVEICIYAAFCLGVVAPSTFIISIGTYLKWPESLISLIAICLLIFQIYFISKSQEHKKSSF